MYTLKRRPEQPALPAEQFKGKRLILVTAHRRENWGEGIRGICLGLSELVDRFPDVVVVYPVHPNPIVRETAEEVLGGKDRVHLLPPLDYVDIVDMMRMSTLILTDSGGIQEEAPSLGKPILVACKTTERPEGVAAGCAKLVGTEPTEIVRVASALLTDPAKYAAMAQRANPYGDGKASARTRKALAYHFGLSKVRPEDFSQRRGEGRKGEEAERQRP